MRFSELIEEIGSLLNSPLKVDDKNSCTILVEDKIEVQIEEDTSKNSVCIISIIFTLPPGKFRENILTSALKANDLFPRIGIFAFDELDSSLILFDFLSLEDASSEMFKEYFLQFANEVILWHEALQRGSSAPDNIFPPSPSSGIFGMKS